MATTPTPSFVSPLCFGSIEEELILPYRVAVELLAVADQVAGRLPRRRSYLADQLRRAAASILLNLAEGAGELAAADKARLSAPASSTRAASLRSPSR